MAKKKDTDRKAREEEARQTASLEETQSEARTASDSDAEEELSAFDLPGVEQSEPQVQVIGLDEIAELENVRTAYHDIEGLAESIYLQGQLQPCMVRPAAPDAEHGRPYELVFGYRRKRAVEYLREQGHEGWDSLRCIVQEVADGEQLAKMIVENFQRESPSPVAEARAMWALKHSTDPPLSNAEVARRLGCHRSQVTHRLSLLRLELKPGSAKPKGLLPSGAAAKDAEDTAGTKPEPKELEGGRKIAGELPASTQAVPGDAEPEELAALEQPAAPESGAPAAETSVELVVRDAPDASAVGDQGASEGQDGIDILAMIDRGEISASTAEVIVGLDNRADQEKLAMLVKRHGWSSRRASAWAKKAKEQREAAEEEAEIAEKGIELDEIPFELITELPRLRPRADITDEEVERIVLFALLRNGMDREMLDYLKHEMGVAYPDLWRYVAGLSQKDVRVFTRRLALRYIAAAHRYHDLGPDLLDAFDDPEGGVIPDAQAPGRES